MNAGVLQAWGLASGSARWLTSRSVGHAAAPGLCLSWEQESEVYAAEVPESAHGDQPMGVARTSLPAVWTRGGFEPPSTGVLEGARESNPDPSGTGPDTWQHRTPFRHGVRLIRTGARDRPSGASPPIVTVESPYS
jgi:hypothetical protein